MTFEWHSIFVIRKNKEIDLLEGISMNEMQNEVFRFTKVLTSKSKLITKF